VTHFSWLCHYLSPFLSPHEKRAETVKRDKIAYVILSIKEVHRMHAWEAIRKTLDYIEDHIAENIAI
jgi:hypothetical protein